MFGLLESVAWMNFCMVGFTLLSFTLLLSLTVEYNRSSLDGMDKQNLPKPIVTRL
jgi:hypothetical protein